MIDTLAPKKPNKAPAKPSRKFLFDSHNFDHPETDEDTAPTYTQEEFEHAREESYKRGHQDGKTEAHQSFEKQTADLLSAIRDHFTILFDEEERRAHMFEKEAAQLAYTVFTKAFPALNEQRGLQEVSAMVSNILETAREQPEITVEVPESYAEAIQTHIDSVLRREGGPHCTVRVNENLGAGQCRMHWANGHAMRDGTHLAEQIRAKIEQVLADKAILTDNDKEEPTGNAP